MRYDEEKGKRVFTKEEFATLGRNLQRLYLDCDVVIIEDRDAPCR